LGFGIFLILLFFWKLAFTNLVLARGDTFLYFYPYWDYRARVLLSGHLPLWNPYLFMGAPFLANSQAGVLYPLNWPLAFFPAPVAVKISILIHLAIALAGALIFARRALGQSPLGALTSAALFALGGYLTSQVEHVNQLQGLAWFPWLLLSIQYSVFSSQNGFLATARRLLPPAILLSLQLLAGHTQSAFISLAGVTLYTIVLAIRTPQSEGRTLALILHPSAFILLALLLSAAQLLPTLELSRQSLRGGGLPLNDALSFSLDPRLLGRALLPGWSRGLFSEFVAHLGVTGLILAIVGAVSSRDPNHFALLILALAGLAFALGAFNPLYALLAALPPFNLFRVPARWLFLFAFSAAMLAGHGLDDLTRSRRFGIWALGFGILPMALTPLANNVTPPGETGPLGAPAAADLAGWLLPLLVLAALIYSPIPERWRARAAFTLALAELFLAAQVLPYNHLTAPEAYTSVRPAMTQLLSSRQPSVVSRQSPPSTLHPPLSTPPPRFLSMSALRFDPGDLAELRGELDPQLPPDAVYDFIVAAKHKEVLSPNLPLAWGIPAVDGFDGGILPLEHYAAFTQLFTGSISNDGRLRENLAAAPNPRLLSFVNARYLITDKVEDRWIDKVFYDLQFTLVLADGETASIAYVPKFQATALALVADEFSGSVHVTFSDGSTLNRPIAQSPNDPVTQSSNPPSLRIPFPRPATPTSITLSGPLTLCGLSLIDERSGAFQSLTLGPYRLVHSGDVKIYENLSTLPRAFVAPDALVVPDDASARAALSDPAFDPASTVILASAPSVSITRHTSLVTRDATISEYAPELIRLTASGPGFLLLTDAYYPGWTATVDGSPAPILRADIMFRAVELPAGTHTVEFRFEPLSVKIGLWISGVAWAVVLASLVLLRNRNPS
jgi:hypothetical protein